MARPFLTGTVLCDIGSGAGFPAIPLKIIDPKLSITLLESQAKKIAFLEKLVKTLDLKRVSIIHLRAENYNAGTFDTILLKAVGSVKKHLKTLAALLVPDGQAVFFKTHTLKKELHQAESLMKRLGFMVHVYKLYTPMEKRPLALVVLKREKQRSKGDLTA